LLCTTQKHRISEQSRAWRPHSRDGEGNVWLAGNSVGDNQILEFTQDGKFLMQIGRAGPTQGSNSPTQHGISSDGKRGPLGIVVPNFITADELREHLADIYHGAATPGIGDMVQLTSSRRGDPLLQMNWAGCNSRLQLDVETPGLHSS
jgi:hypothetical protein